MELLKNIIFRSVLIVMTLHVLNIAMDYPDELEKPILEELAECNDKSFFEFALYILISIENSVGEFGDDEARFGSTFDSSNLFFYCQQADMIFNRSFIETKVYNLYKFSHKETSLTIIIPPPKI
jgi:hypothetical protein